MDDTIYRQQAINAFYLIRCELQMMDDTQTADKMLHGLWLAEREIKALPSAQPDKLTDKEQRIFLSAMGREEKVCKEVDDEWRDCREPYEDSLVHVCKEIRRKVKGALWT